jgi:hypothetical protein
MHIKANLRLAYEAAGQTDAQFEFERFVVSESQSAPRISNTAGIKRE